MSMSSGCGRLSRTGSGFDVLDEAAVDPLETVGDASGVECVPVVHQVLDQIDSLCSVREPFDYVRHGGLEGRAVFG